MKNTVVIFKGKPYSEDERLTHRVNLIPLSLISLVTPLKNAGFKVVLIDQGNRKEDAYASKPNGLWSDVVCVGISALTGNEVKEGLKFAQYVREKNKEIPIVWGGWHVSIFPEQSIEDPHVDVVVKGLGQKIFPKLAERFKNNEGLEGIEGICYRKDDKIISRGQDFSMKLDDVPLPAFEVLDLEYYRKQSLALRYKPFFRDINITGHLYYITSFGCPNLCAYCCSNIVFARRLYRYNVEKVIEQLKWLVREKRFNYISFQDANFFIDKNRVKTICELILKNSINCVWDGQMYVRDIIRYENIGLWPLLQKSGCVKVHIGAESGSQEVLNYIGKSISVKDIHLSARILKKYEIEAAYNYLFGLPKYEEKKDVHESIKLAVELKKINPDFSLPISFYVPFPGTSMFQDALERGFQAPQSLEAWAQFDTEYDYSSKAYPWKSKNRETLIYDAITFYIPLAIPGDMHRGTLTRVKDKMEKSHLRIFIKIAHNLAKFRVKYSFYRFPLERLIFKAYLSCTKKFEYVPGGTVKHIDMDEVAIQQ